MCVLLCVVCTAAAETNGDFEYQVLDDGTAKITKFNGKARRVEIPSELDGLKVTSIGDSAFSRCMLTHVTIPDSVTSIGERAFSWCSSLTRVTIPDSVISIGDEAFLLCIDLMHVTIPESVISIGNSVFYGCISLTSVTIPDSVTSIGANPFVDCEKLQTVNVSPKHPVLATIDGVLFNKVEKKLIWYPIGRNETNYVIPQGIVSIGDQAFMLCFSLTSVAIPDSVTDIGNSAFWGCTRLTSVTIPDSVTNIGDNALYKCNSLTLTVCCDSFAEQYAKEHSIPFNWPEASTDWLNW